MIEVLTQRPVSPEDEGFLIGLYASTRAEELSQLPWEADQLEYFVRMQFAAQQQDYQRRFPGADHRILLLDGRPAGRIYLSRSEDEIRLLDLALVPDVRRKGIGSGILRDLIAEARKARKPVRVYLETYNPALGLFERLGFSRTEDIGSHYLLEWRAFE